MKIRIIALGCAFVVSLFTGQVLAQNDSIPTDTIKADTIKVPAFLIIQEDPV